MSTVFQPCLYYLQSIFLIGAPLLFSFLIQLNACMNRSIPVQKALLGIERWLEHPVAKSSM